MVSRMVCFTCERQLWAIGVPCSVRVMTGLCEENKEVGDMIHLNPGSVSGHESGVCGFVMGVVQGVV